MTQFPTSPFPLPPKGAERVFKCDANFLLSALQGGEGRGEVG